MTKHLRIAVLDRQVRLMDCEERHSIATRSVGYDSTCRSGSINQVIACTPADAGKHYPSICPESRLSKASY